MVEGFEEEAPPPSEGSMHINGRGHRPLTSPFRRGRGTGLCEIGFNDPIVDCVMHLHTVHTVYLTFCSTLRTLHPHCMSLRWTVQPQVWGLDTKCCPVSHLPCASCCLVLLLITPTSVLTSSPISSPPQPPLLLSRPYLRVPSLLFHAAFLNRDLVT